MQRPGNHQVVETLIRVDPRFRDRSVYPNTNEYRIEFGKTVKNVVGIAVHDACFPVTETAVTPHTNTIAYVMRGTVYTHSIDAGTYTVETLVDSINQALQTDIDVTYDDVSRRLTFTTKHAGEPFQIDLTATTLARILGFGLEDGFTATSEMYSPPGIVDVRGCTYLCIRSNDIKTPGTGMHTDPGLAILNIDSSSQFTRPVDRSYPVSYFDTIREKMNGIHIRIERDDGTLYETAYTNHYIIIRLFTLNERLIQMSNRHT